MQRFKKEYSDPEFTILFLQPKENVCNNSILGEEEAPPEGGGIDTPLDEWD